MSNGCQNKLAQDCYSKLEKFINELPEKKGALISVLHRAQDIFGYLPAEVQKFISEKLDIPLAKVYGVVTFYSFFTMTPKGEYPISVCLGTACYVRGAEKVLDEFKRELDLEVGETGLDGKFSLDALRCVGACGLAPVVLVGEKVYGRVTPEQVKDILKEYKNV
ncbi:NADH-quinone oxidoreductase subunit NuoE family protein [Haliovirga abyssi]|uniref:NADH dehydrogenase n=1 Tax=Haliovirga abyssi TaxID=2996794 RepID=A0AAU9DQC8_9FUSO|nr:NAD(P)H-dependent oxidoreductase subunit E [Haliovirga abyssi]BDU50668.1 NADH dehydrogenase [Haliovirga abyssi]